MSTLTQLSDAELDAVNGGFFNTVNIANILASQAAANVNASLLSLVEQKNVQVIKVSQEGA